MKYLGPHSNNLTQRRRGAKRDRNELDRLISAPLRLCVRYRHCLSNAGIAIIIRGAASGLDCVAVKLAAIVLRAKSMYSGLFLARAKKIRFCAATELPVGIAPSTTSLPRAGSVSWSFDVKKNPPPEASENSSICLVVSAAASSSQRWLSVA